MKKLKNIFFPILITVLLATNVSPVLASDPPDPPGQGHGTGNDLPPGGGAPIGGGTFILIALGVAYGSKKIYDINKEELEEIEG